MIRKMQNSDVHAVAQIEHQVQSHPWSMKQFEESVESYVSTVIEQHGKVVGFCILQPVVDEANLLLIANGSQAPRRKAVRRKAETKWNARNIWHWMHFTPTGSAPW